MRQVLFEGSGNYVHEETTIRRGTVLSDSWARLHPKNYKAIHTYIYIHNIYIYIFGFKKVPCQHKMGMGSAKPHPNVYIYHFGASDVVFTCRDSKRCPKNEPKTKPKIGPKSGSQNATRGAKFVTQTRTCRHDLHSMVFYLAILAILFNCAQQTNNFNQSRGKLRPPKLLKQRSF